MAAYDAVIVGGGIFGLSTAVQLGRSKYRVLVIDKFEIPSPISASNDYNKIVRLEYNDEAYAALAIEAMGYWKGQRSELVPSSLLHNCYYHCGRLSVIQDESSSRYAFEESSLKLLQDRFGLCKEVSQFPSLTCNGRFPQFANSQKYDKIRYNPECGIGMARDSLVAMKQYAESLGVQFHENDGAVQVQSGMVLCESGARFHGRKIVVCCGANTSSLLPVQDVVHATGLYVGHVQLTNHEYERLKDIPVVFNSGLGYIFPPDRHSKVLKICTSAMSTYDLASGKTAAVYKALQPHRAPGISIDAVVRIRAVLGKYLPELVFDPKRSSKLRDIIDCKICWISDTSNSDFVIDAVPSMSNVYVCCGDSGHAFKFLPNIGKYIQQRLENTLAPSLARKWRFRNSDWRNTEIEWRVEPQKQSVQETEWYRESYGNPSL